MFGVDFYIVARKCRENRNPSSSAHAATDDTQPWDVLSASPLLPAVVVGAEPKVPISSEAERERFQKKVPAGEKAAEGALLTTTSSCGDAHRTSVIYF